VAQRNRSLARVLPAFPLVLACATSPLGRQQLRLYPDAEVAEMGVAAFQRMKQELPQARAPREQRYVQCVASALAGALEGVQAGQSWEVVLFDEPSANAFALPGGKIGVHSGMLEVAENADQLAAVLGHEISHVIAAHTNERLSTQAVAETGLSAVQVLLGSDTAGQRELMAALGLGAQVGVLLPFNRAQESEADVLGLRLMARAGFDPKQAVELWRRMQAKGKGAPPEFLSTHPSEASRIALLERRLAEAIPVYRAALARGARPGCSVRG